MKIEDCFHDTILPVNSLAILNRLIELFRENKTNSFLTERMGKDLRVRKAMWLLLELYNTCLYKNKAEGVEALTEFQVREYFDICKLEKKEGSNKQ